MLNELLKNKWVNRSLIVMIFVLATLYIFVLKPGIEQVNDAEVNQQAQVAGEMAESESSAATDAEQNCFIVQEIDGAVNVYRYENGNKVLYQETDIAFELLSTEDQELLKKGVQLSDEQELAGFMENYDS